MEIPSLSDIEFNEPGEWPQLFKILAVLLVCITLLVAGYYVIIKDKTIEGQTSTARAYIDNIDSNRLYYHQTTATGFGTFVSGETVEEVDGAGEGVIDSGAALPEVDPESGAILFIDNRSPVVRTAAQNEDIKVIIQF